MYISTFSASYSAISASENNNNKNSKIYALFNLIMKKYDPGRESVCNAFLKSDSMQMVVFAPYVCLEELQRDIRFACLALLVVPWARFHIRCKLA
jgi:hypothetical protein